MANKREQKISDSSTAAATKAQGQADQIFGQQQAANANLASKYNSMYTNPMSSTEKGATLSSAAGASDAARGGAEQRVARSHNAAGLGDMATKLALQKGESMGKANASIQGEEQRRRMEAARGLSSLYGMNNNLYSSTANLGPAYMNVGQQAAAQSQSQLLPALIGAGSNMFGAAVGKWG